MVYTLLDEFFSQKKIWIQIREGEKEEKLEVRKAKGGLDVFADYLGRIITGFWRPKAKPKETPFQRAKDEWRPEEKIFIVFERGFVSAWRSRHLALFGAWKIRLPQLEQVKEIASQMRTEILSACTVSPKLMRKLWQTGFIDLKSRKIETKETQTKILFLYRDAQNGLNIGALLARNTAIAKRIKERLYGIYSWVSVYSSQSNFLTRMQMRADEIFKEIKGQITSLRNNYFLKESEDSHRANIQIEKAQEGLEALKPLRPYNLWAAQMMKDLELLGGAISSNDRFAGRVLANRVFVSLRIKQEQRQLDGFLLSLGKNQIDKKWNGGFYENWFKGLIKTFGSLKKLEDEAQFRRPVCKAIIKFLYEGETLLAEESFLKLHKPLQRAYELL